MSCGQRSIDGLRLDLQYLCRCESVRIEVVLANRPAGMRYVIPYLEVALVERAAPSGPVARSPAKLAQPCVVQLVVLVTDNHAAVKVL